MATPCLCTEPAAGPTCELIAGPGITINTVDDQHTVTATSALAWQAWTPATTNFTLGNAVNASRYLINGKTVDLVFAVRFGTTSTWTATAWEIGMPPACTPYLAPSTLGVGHVRGRASFKDITAVDQFFKGEVFVSSTGLPLRLRFGDDAGGIGTSGNVRQGTPFTFANGDEIVFSTRLEIV